MLKTILAFLSVFGITLACRADVNPPTGYPDFITLNMSGFTDNEMNGTPVFLLWQDSASLYSWYTDGGSFIYWQPTNDLSTWNVTGFDREFNDLNGLNIQSQNFSWSGGNLPFLPPTGFQYTNSSDGTVADGSFSIQSVPEPVGLIVVLFPILLRRNCNDSSR